MVKRKNVFMQTLIYVLVLALVFSPFQSLAAVTADEATLTVQDAIENNEGTATVEGYIVGHTTNANSFNFSAPFGNDFNLILADDPEERDSANFLLVQITSDFRGSFGLESNPSIIGEKIQVHGSLENYFSQAGLRSPTSMTFVEGYSPEPDPELPEVTSIADARNMEHGEEVTIGGVVTTTPGAWGGSGFYLQDTTGGTYVFGSNEVSQGDDVIITGETGEFNGEFQISQLSSVTVLGDGELPTPSIVTPSEIGDSIQGQLVTLESVTIADLSEVNNFGTFEFQAELDNESVSIRVDNRTGLEYDDFAFGNGDVVDVTGIASVFNGTFQVKPRGDMDIVLISDSDSEEPTNPTEPELGDDKLDLTILHTNDIHSRIDDLGKVAAFINGERDAVDNSLYLDAGDIFSGSPVNDINLGEPIIDILNEMKLDALAIGNHEFDYGQDVFAERVVQSNFPWLSANMTVDSSIAIEQPEPYTIFEFEEFDVGVFSLTQNPPATAPSGVVDIEFHDYVETALAYQEELEEQADVIIALTHIGYGDDRRFAEEVDYFDVIIGGHTHTVLNTPQVVNGTPIAQAGGYASHVGKLSLAIDAETKEVSQVQGHLQDVSQLQETDEEVQAIIDVWNEQMDEILGIVIGESDTGLTRDGRYERDVALGNFWTDAMAFAADADIAFTNNGGIRDSIAAGDVTIGDIYRIEPFDNQVMLFEMTGEAIKDVIKFSYSRNNRNQIDLQLSGLHYTILTNASGQYVDVELELEGQPLDLNATYLVAVPDYIGTGGSGYDFQGTVVYAEVTPMTTAMIEYGEFLTAQGEKLNYGSEGRISTEVDPNAGGPIGEVIGSTEQGLFSANKGVMDVGLGNLYTDAVRSLTNADIGLLNGSSVTGAIPAGDITREQIEALDGYGNQIVVVETTGSRLKEMILAQSNYHGQVDVQASGIHYTLVEGNGSPRFENVMISLEDGTSIEDNGVYKVAYNDFMHNGGHYTLSDSTVEENGFVWEAVAEFVEAQIEAIDYVEGERISIYDPSQPVDPIEPVDPIDPDPVDPIEPVDPDPVDPVDPVEPPSEPKDDLVVKDGKIFVSDELVNRVQDGGILELDVRSELFVGHTVIELSSEQIDDLVEKGATIQFVSSTVTVEIPATIFEMGQGAVTFSFDEVNEEELKEEIGSEPGTLVSTIFDFTLTQGDQILSHFGEQFATLHFQIDEDLLTDEDMVHVFYLNETTNVWEKVGGTYLNGYVTAETNHFSLFAAFEEEEDPIDPTPEDPSKPEEEEEEEEKKLSAPPETEGDDDDNQDSGSKKESGEDSKLPDTATNSANIALMGVILFLIGFMILLMRRRKLV
ncbi:5'-nucleotidase C-terminal domain-containing protein [Halalkalibacter sp. AB-rgal2]|uniref:5'-nucleotidase C-terminal domain-containing protein n=1 Tax=Halalkalibacter sp. AB-rgal2 TaxID=3242695 RepID=UPI00359E8285